MSSDRDRSSLVKRYEDLRRVQTPAPMPEDDVMELEEESPEDKPQTYSMIGPEGGQKLMVEFRQVGGRAKALAYSYLVGIDFDPGGKIVLEFTSYRITLEGRNLRPMFDGLLSQRYGRVLEIDTEHADALLAESDMAVTRIDIENLNETK